MKRNPLIGDTNILGNPNQYILLVFFVLHNLTANYIVSNKKLKNTLGKPLPVSSKEGLVNTIRSFMYA